MDNKHPTSDISKAVLELLTNPNSESALLDFIFVLRNLDLEKKEKELSHEE